MTDMVKLIIKAGDEISKSFDLIKDKSVIGRDPNSDIFIEDIEVSKKHLAITRKGNTFQIEDQNSTNGTFLNGKKLKKPTAIKNGDLISLGKNNVLEFVYEKIDEISESPEIPESSQLDEPGQFKATKVEEEITEVEKPLKERADKVEPERINNKDRKKETSNQKTEDQKKPTWVIILIAALVFIVIFCVIPLIVIEATNQWCNLFAGFFNSMSPGVCP
jgi:pSer/pThr/pTyr-binding forkhead associated (FHA) protein